MEPGHQAGPGILPSAILRPHHSHEVLSLSETWMSGNATGGRPAWDYQGPLCSGSPQTSLRVLTLTPARTWAPSSPSLRPSSSHQGPSLSETQMSGRQDSPSVLFSPQGLTGWMIGAGIYWVPSVFPWGPLSPPTVPYLVSRQDLGFSPLPKPGPVPLTRSTVFLRPR